jgi:hypothetical protein
MLAVLAVLGVVGVVVAGGDTPAPPARPAMVMGTVVSVDAAKSTLVVKTMARGEEAAKEVTLTTTAETKITLDAEAAKLEDLKAEMRVNVTLVKDTTDKAASINATSKGLMGSVVKVDGTNVVVSTGRGDTAKEVTVATDKDTKILLLQRGTRGTPAAEPKVGKLEDLKAGMRVTVIPETGTAKKILASAAGGGRRGGGGN